MTYTRGIRMKIVSLPPPAASFFESMRDVGYTLETAFADIIDNSLTAKSTEIDILVDSGEEPFRICIADNGIGMDYETLLEAMTYASRDPRTTRDRFDLGRFGLGLKLASLSQGRRLTVVTRRNNSVHAGIWDQDYIDEHNDWLLQIPDDPESILESIPLNIDLDKSGTVVIWEKLERIDGLPETGFDQTAFVKRIDDVRAHLELVFHRFLSGEAGTKKCGISINNLPLDGIDPFNSKHPATGIDPDVPEKINEDVSFQVFTLPHHSRVDKRDWEKYGLEDGYLKNQGLYIYREKRLIIYGTWLRLARQTALNQLTRVKIDITNRVDDAWGITLDKSRAKLPPIVRDTLRNRIERIGASSKRAYTRRGQALTTEEYRPTWKEIQQNNQITYQVNHDNPVMKRFLDNLSGDNRKEFGKILTFIGSTIPLDAMYARLSNDPSSVGVEQVDQATLKEWCLQHYDFLMEMGNNDQDRAINMMRSIEPFKSNWDDTEYILEAERPNDD